MSKNTLGIDEVGRGAWAGPLVVAAVLLGDQAIEGLNDSKKLSAKKRQALAAEIKVHSKACATGWVTSGEIDQLGLAEAHKLAARRALNKLDQQIPHRGMGYSKIIIDGTVRLIDDPRVVTLPRADALIPAVSAASIVAKVARDLYMTKLAAKYPQFGFDKHVGYGTAQHQRALDQHGACPEHRRSFRPVAESLGLIPEKPPKIHQTIGRIAEDQAAEYLIDQGHTILERNWRRKACEIDIVSTHDETIYFTEVKYRKDSRAGDGVEAIDSRKERQMRFAARVYLEYYQQTSLPAALSVISLTGDPPTVERYIVDIDN